MEYLYIDESGTMTTEHNEKFPFFVICLIHVLDKRKLKTIVKRFISKNMEELKLLNSQKMFKEKKFVEIKGSELSYSLKIDFANYLCKYNVFKIIYIDVDNNQVDQKLYKNKARAFNYLVDLCLGYSIRKKILPKGDYSIQIDERNIKTNAQKTLEDYLNMELGLKKNYVNDVTVEYFDSADNTYIQISDFFSNLYFSYKMNNEGYKEIINQMIENNVLKLIFKFPENKNK
jgi:hypothetical protein